MASTNRTNEAHSHDEDHKHKDSVIDFAGKFHPVVVHFPVALLITAGLAEFLRMLTRKETFGAVTRFLLILGAASAVVAVILGLAAEQGSNYPAALSAYLSWHRIFGFGTGALSVICLILGEIHIRKQAKRTKWAYRAVLLASMLFVGVTGHLGATLVYGPNHFSM